MPLKLYLHPLASFCWKALIAFYENWTPFEPVFVDPMDPDAAAAFRKISPMGKMPALVDEARGQAIWESTIVIEYLDAFYPGAHRLLPDDPDKVWQVRMWDRFFDHYVHEPMQKFVADWLRPEGRRDSFGIEQARAQLREAYAVLEREMAARTWAADETFSMADCAAAPALFYANVVEPVGEGDRNVLAYLDLLMARPSFARVLEEAQPYFRLYPFESELKVRYPGLFA